MDGFPSGQRGQTVNLLSTTRRFESFSIHSVMADRRSGELPMIR